MRTFAKLAAAFAVAALIPATAFAGDCPEPETTQGVDEVNGSFTVSAKVEVVPFMWIANASEDTLSKIDTNANKEVARYSTAFWNGGIGGAGHGLPNHSPWGGPAPSRSAVDTDGNAYVANRGFWRYAEVMKILTKGCIDRNNDGVCQTSKDLNNDGRISTNEMYPIVDSNHNGVIDDNEIRDERVVWVRRVGHYNQVARALAIDKQGNLWVGMYNAGVFYKVDPTTGATIQTVYTGVRAYGAAVDSKNRIFSMGIGNVHQRRFLATNPTAQSTWYVLGGYAITIGRDHNNTEWVVSSNYQHGYAFQLTNPDTLARSYPLHGGFYSLGISFDNDGHIVFSDARHGPHRSGATKARTDGSIIWSREASSSCYAGDQRGALVDANNDVWIVSRTRNRVCKYLANGTRDAEVPVGRSPYTYSDATGSALLASDPTGRVTFVSDAAAAAFDWSGADLCFAGGGNVTVKVAAANTKAGLEFANPVDMTVTETNGQLCGKVPNGVIGQFLAVTFTIKERAKLEKPLAKGLASKDMQIRMLALGAVGALPSPSKASLDAVVEALGVDDRRLRDSALRSVNMLRAGAKAAVPALLKLTEHKNKRVRMAAAQALGNVGDSSAQVLATLKNLLADKKDRPALGAAQALSQLNALDTLQEALKSPSKRVRRSAVEALPLVKVLDERRVQMLIGAIDDPEWEVRAAAISAFHGRADDAAQKALPALRKATKDENQVVAGQAKATIEQMALARAQPKPAAPAGQPANAAKPAAAPAAPRAP